jgi:hypothetical protein
MEFAYIVEKMRTSQRIRDVVDKIAAFHGRYLFSINLHELINRVEKIQVFDKKPPKNEDPTKPPKLDGITE